ncbi:UDP-2,4-diacetamido-2,4,6-trideoxy-beta-L-altropyranose hydrolase [Salipaludibacillus neizhouensis]|uniref:UDP-2,4-diacetamido-2,4, 6-trideoxy-beta-L-altropyranose hydrolase n=1 Tax=Salipaludibacillus neizhouensis TaxID=885475 RepID=A0A3A9KCS8_9BACI|nr:UDP-2,4-diacetamido-2,4,6-trideoxy-beta-L-altropyranose hydrolase [Salipaludibacillus neizhouensis]RKL68342.1 UDP-2,4-diacetamido-2,4,6-trideoxy-beta-L-altropyranose hydrolase [Salipaludibacillus neizhouensis]
MKTAVIRVDASVEIGTGHVIRCLTLAEDLKSCYDITFITSDYSGHLAEFIQSKGFNVILLHKSSTKCDIQDELQHSHWLGGSQEEDARETLHIMKSQNRVDLMVVDHYALDYRWEKIIRNRVRKIFVIDDLADRKHECDVLLDQNYYLDMGRRYDNLVDKNCKRLLGPKHALLRKEFKEAKKKLRNRSGEVERILIFFGGSDPTNETTKAVRAIEKLNRKDILVDVVVGASNPNKETVKELVDKLPHVTYHCQVSNMAELMVKADLAIGAGGSTTWERCYLGLPTITVEVAFNQMEILQAVEKSGAIINLGYSSQVSIENLRSQLLRLICNCDILIEMSIQSRRLLTN